MEKTKITLSEKKKSAIAKKNDGNDLIFRILHNILNEKSEDKYKIHTEDSSFCDVYSNVSVEKSLMKCFDLSVVKKMIEIQCKYSNITEKRHHYWYMMKSLPKTRQYINWKN